MFKNIIHIGIICVALFTLAACGEKTAQKETAAEELAATETSPEPAANMTGVLNPNQAGAEALGALGFLTPDIIDAITTNRPFLSQSELNAALNGLADEAAMEQLAKQIFVPINLNTASREEILMVPGVGEKMAHEFEEYRPYKKIEQFRREMGKYVDEEEIARYEQYVFVPIELNTASKEEILAIPGVGDRMLHEFEEYRPYKSMDQFKREIGKYVDDKELARLARYVRLDE